MFETTEKTIAERITNQMRRDVVSGRFEPGSRLRFEHLRELYGAGMGTLRESLARLAAEGLVIAEGQRGFHVAAVSVADLWDLTNLRRQIECEALRRAIERGDDRWESGVVAAFHMLSKVSRPITGPVALVTEQAFERHRRYHFALVAACDSPRTLRLLDQLYDGLERYGRFWMAQPEAPRDVAGEHEALMAAALKRDAQRAVAVLTHHLEQTARDIVALAPHWAAPDEARPLRPPASAAAA